MKVGIVLVTFNRLQSLREALRRYEQQTKLPEYILVVNNASTDGTKQFLNEWKAQSVKGIEKIVITSNENLGGSGGYALGIKNACDLDSEFIFLADDDAMADVDMLAKLEKGYSFLKKNNIKNISALCTAIFNYDKHEYLHRCLVKSGAFGVKFVGVPEEEYSRKYFRVDILTFVGACISKKAIEQIGNVKTEYFIYFDDSEYSMRLNKIGNIYCIPNSIMHHDVGKSGNIESWKSYYDTRNWIDLVKNYYSKKLLYCTVIKMYLKRCSFLAVIARNRSKKYRKMCKKGIKDGLEGNLGLDSKYKPGIKI